MNYKRYHKKLSYSYAIGSYPTIELFENAPDRSRGIIYHSKFASSKVKKKIDELSVARNIFINEDDELIEKITGKGNVYVVGVFDKFKMELDESADHVVLVSPSDRGNLGTIMRTMLAFGKTDLAIIKPAADIFHPDVIRSSMGAIFSLRVELFDDFEEYQSKFGQRDFYPLMTNGQTSLDKIKYKQPYSLIFGNESAGLDDEYTDIGQTICIKQSSKVDSLNLAVAVGIVLQNCQK